MACVFVCDKVRYLDSISSEYRGLSSCAAPGEPAAEHSGYSSGVLSYNLATQGNHSKPQAQAFLFRHDIDKKARQQHSVSHVTLYLFARHGLKGSLSRFAVVLLVKTLNSEL